MNQKKFSFVTGTIFTLIAVLHLARIAYGGEVAIHGWNVPMWASWAGVIVAGYLGQQGLKLGKKQG